MGYYLLAVSCACLLGAFFIDSIKDTQKIMLTILGSAGFVCAWLNDIRDTLYKIEDK